MPTHLEKVRFSERLLQSLSQAGVSAASPTELARKFNLLYPDTPISVQAVRRWLEGTAIPTQDKLVVPGCACHQSGCASEMTRARANAIPARQWVKRRYIMTRAHWPP